ncbi:MAG: hypothetical protein H6737_04505 [Alphaproteobacteria bacterium]|nr:hypothetical protein [Alphaproteobacteria bacterium]
MHRMLVIPTLLVLAGTACKKDGETGDTDTDTDASLQWYTTCGDPACSGYSGPYDGVPACTDEVEGGTCGDDGAECDFMSDCNAVLLCAADDPKDQPGGCPISKAEAKREIAYLDEAALKRRADEALAMRLATWRYRWEDGGTRPHLGFIIDDAPSSAAVRSDGERVDLYGYTSLALAAVQVQQQEIEALRAEIAALRAEIARR